jgi:hypothetical protein
MEETKLEVHRQEYRTQCAKMSTELYKAQNTYYTEKIKACGKNQKELFKVTKNLLEPDTRNVLPSHASTQQLAEDFNRFFIEKINRLRDGIQTQDDQPDRDLLTHDTPFNGIPLDRWRLVSCIEVKKILTSMSNKTCDLDPIPTELMKECCGALLPSLTQIVNASLMQGNVPSSLKKGLVRPKLKKNGLDREEMKNYRPVSNIPFISKIMEKAVAHQITDHMILNDLNDAYQSAYRENHSTETALLKIQTDILKILDQGKMAVLIMTDLTAAFDTIDHNILAKRLDHSFGIRGQALAWFESYLNGRKQSVMIEESTSSECDLPYGVPQGSILGPVLYCLYTKPVGKILKSHGLDYHCYADDAQAYTMLESLEDWPATANTIRNCMQEYETWMMRNKLKLNPEKFEFIIFHKRHNQITRSDFTLRLQSGTFEPVSEVRDLGVILDATLSMESHVNSVVRGCRHQLRSISKIRRNLTRDSCQSLISALVFSKLDYANSLLTKLPKSQVHKLQLVQNAAARLLTGARYRDHITPIRKELHWLPVSHRIQFKLLMLCFKARTGRTPNYISDQVHHYRPVQHLRSADEELLVVPESRTPSYGDRCFDHSMAVAWNALPRHLRNERDPLKFKKMLKTFLFTDAYPF